MTGLPSGTVTLLFSDLEGSTRLLKQLGDRYADVLADHHRLLREAFTQHGGQVVDTQGDAFFVAFPRARDAVEAAVAAQRALAAQRWPDGVELRVRMAIHTGEPTIGADRYVGLGVHRAARISSIAHGGQVLLSTATRELVEDQLPAGVGLRAPMGQIGEGPGRHHVARTREEMDHASGDWLPEDGLTAGDCADRAQHLTLIGALDQVTAGAGGRRTGPPRRVQRYQRPGAQKVGNPAAVVDHGGVQVQSAYRPIPTNPGGLAHSQASKTTFQRTRGRH